ncbi:MAG TPA: winged helix-turn-helix domain-containing protein [Candidatus Thermoplasmatota archaeon]|nr:winged helix-turn-helix domain-containing protein [Candidatus Thermoplasmatota archaeon]
MAAVLTALLEAAERKDVRLTSVAAKANLPYDRLVLYLEDMAQMGLVTRDKPPVVTPGGREFLESCKRWTSVLDRFGLD